MVYAHMFGFIKGRLIMFGLINVCNSGLLMTKCFSVVHRLHRFVRLE